MPSFWTLLRAGAVVVGGSAALLAGGIAHADPGPAVPAVPNIADQLISTAANAPQMLQSLATALGAKPPLPATPPPLASAALQMPQLPPGASSAIPNAASLVPGANSLLPGATPSTAAGVPAATPTTTGPGQLLPEAKLDLPQLPFLPPLPQQVSLPGDLTSLATGGAPAPHAAPAPAAVPAPANASAQASNPLMQPLLSALP
jgi:hypothetical protein